VKLTLVIPCYNESRNLPSLIERINKSLSGRDVEVVLVDNGSTDLTSELMPTLINDSAFVRSIRLEVNQGYGGGILAGLKESNTTFIGWTHADLQTDPSDVLIGLNILLEEDSGDSDGFIKGRRYGRPFADVVFTLGMSLFESLLMREKMVDINAQPTLFRRTFFESWINPPQDFSLDLYAYYLAKKSGMKVRRFPVIFGERLHGISHWNVDLKSKLNFIRRTLEYSFELKKNIER
jgi:glycosyltransferase involved in cell wall biosynthesis